VTLVAAMRPDTRISVRALPPRRLPPRAQNLFHHYMLFNVGEFIFLETFESLS
jgi:hypothetical protein